MRTMHTDFDDVVEVDDQLMVVGDLRGGAVVRSGGHLVVHGNVVGDVVIEDRAFLTVTGAFLGSLTDNAGMAVLSGVVEKSALTGAGKVVLGAETIILGDEDDEDVVKVHRDGSIEALQGRIAEGTSTIDGTHFLVWDRAERNFRPLSL